MASFMVEDDIAELPDDVRARRRGRRVAEDEDYDEGALFMSDSDAEEEENEGATERALALAPAPATESVEGVVWLQEDETMARYESLGLSMPPPPISFPFRFQLDGVPTYVDELTELRESDVEDFERGKLRPEFYAERTAAALKPQPPVWKRSMTAPTRALLTGGTREGYRVAVYVPYKPWFHVKQKDGTTADDVRTALEERLGLEDERDAIEVEEDGLWLPSSGYERQPSVWWTVRLPNHAAVAIASKYLAESLDLEVTMADNRLIAPELRMCLDTGIRPRSWITIRSREGVVQLTGSARRVHTHYELSLSYGFRRGKAIGSSITTITTAPLAHCENLQNTEAPLESAPTRILAVDTEVRGIHATKDVGAMGEAEENTLFQISLVLDVEPPLPQYPDGLGPKERAAFQKDWLSTHPRVRHAFLITCYDTPSPGLISDMGKANGETTVPFTLIRTETELEQYWALRRLLIRLHATAIVAHNGDMFDFGVIFDRITLLTSGGRLATLWDPQNTDAAGSPAHLATRAARKPFLSKVWPHGKTTQDIKDALDRSKKTVEEEASRLGTRHFNAKALAALAERERERGHTGIVPVPLTSILSSSSSSSSEESFKDFVKTALAVTHCSSRAWQRSVKAAAIGLGVLPSPSPVDAYFWDTLSVCPCTLHIKPFKGKLLRWLRTPHRDQFDTLVYARMNLPRSASLALKNVAVYLKLDVRKHDVGFEEMWRCAGAVERAADMGEPQPKEVHLALGRIAAYCVQDSCVCKGVLDALNTSPFSAFVSWLSWTAPSDLGRCGTTHRSHHMQVAFNYFYGRTMRHRTDGYVGDYDGAFCLDPISGFYEGRISGTTDVKSLYPTMIREWNIGADTLVMGPLGDDSVEGVERRARELEAAGLVLKRYVFHGRPFYTVLSDVRNPEARVSVLSYMMEYLLGQRGVVRKHMKGVPKDSVEYGTLDVQQNVLKLFANGTYGYLGCDTSKLKAISLAAMVTYNGRTTITIMRDSLNAFTREQVCEIRNRLTAEKGLPASAWNVEAVPFDPIQRVAGGDTDSCFVLLPFVDDEKPTTYMLAHAYLTYLAKFLAHEKLNSRRVELGGQMVLEIEPEYIGRRLILIKKKMYAVVKCLDGAAVPQKWEGAKKGIATVRGDVPKCMRDAIERILDLAQSKGLEAAVNEARDFCRRLLIFGIENLKACRGIDASYLLGSATPMPPSNLTVASFTKLVQIQDPESLKNGGAALGQVQLWKRLRERAEAGLLPPDIPVPEIGTMVPIVLIRPTRGTKRRFAGDWAKDGGSADGVCIGDARSTSCAPEIKRAKCILDAEPRIKKGECSEHPLYAELNKMPLDISEYLTLFGKKLEFFNVGTLVALSSVVNEFRVLAKALDGVATRAHGGSGGGYGCVSEEAVSTTTERVRIGDAAESAPKATERVRIEDAPEGSANVPFAAESAPKATQRVRIEDAPEGSANGTFAAESAPKAAHRACIEDAANADEPMMECGAMAAPVAVKVLADKKLSGRKRTNKSVHTVAVEKDKEEESYF